MRNLQPLRAGDETSTGLRTSPPGGPPARKQIIQASLLITEPCPELQNRLRKIRSCHTAKLHLSKPDTHYVSYRSEVFRLF